MFLSDLFVPKIQVSKSGNVPSGMTVDQGITLLTTYKSEVKLSEKCDALVHSHT